MPDLTTSVDIKDLTKHEAWNRLIDFQNYSNFMDSVKNVVVRDTDEDGCISEWTVIFNDCELVWTEKDEFHPESKITFNQIDGDIEKWQGYWLITENETGCTITLHISFDIGIPSLADLLHPIGSKVIKENCIQMLDDLRDEMLIRHVN